MASAGDGLGALSLDLHSTSQDFSVVFTLGCARRSLPCLPNSPHIMKIVFWDDSDILESFFFFSSITFFPLEGFVEMKFVIAFEEALGGGSL